MTDKYVPIPTDHTINLDDTYRTGGHEEVEILKIKTTDNQGVVVIGVVTSNTNNSIYPYGWDGVGVCRRGQNSDIPSMDLQLKIDPEEQYIRDQEASGLVAGDWVEITNYPVIDNYRGWGVVDSGERDYEIKKVVGGNFQIKGYGWGDPSRGFNLDGFYHFVPWWCLTRITEPVEEVTVEEVTVEEICEELGRKICVVEYNISHSSDDFDLDEFLNK